MPIANYFIVRILNRIRIETEYDEDDVDMMRYSLEAILWEIEKTIYLLLIFILLGAPWQFLTAIVAIMTIRPTAGGFHSSTAWGCFFWTLFGLLLGIFVLPLIPLMNITVILVGAFSLLATYIATPVRSKQMESVADTSKDKQKKHRATLITVVWFIVIFFSQDFFLTEVAMWIIFLQNLQLIIEYARKNLDLR